MPLIHPRVLQKQLKDTNGPIPAAHAAILSAWAKKLDDGVYDRETQNDGEFIQRILIDVLGYTGASSHSSWSVAKNQPVGSGNVDVALGRFSASTPPEIHAPFELKGARTKDLDAVMSGRNKSPVQQAWEYAMDTKGAKWVLVSNYRQIRLYAVGYGRKDYETFDLATMSAPPNYHRFMLMLAASNLLSGNTLRLLKDSDAAEKDITNELYTDYKATRSQLIGEILTGNAKMPPLKAIQLAQTVLDRVLFVAFAEDKGLLKSGTLKEAFETKNPYSPQPAWDNFKGLFAAIDKGNTRLNIPGYNGGLFRENPDIDNLGLSEEVCKRFAGLGEYNYDSEVSVNILGYVFEQSISDIEQIKNELDPNFKSLEEVGSKRRTDGIFYTPPFVTRHIVEQAVGRWLADRKVELGFDKVPPLTDDDYASIKIVSRGKKRGQVVFNANVQKHVELWETYRDKLSGIRVVDPACGSGAFLNEVFDFLYREGQTINKTLETFYGNQINLFRWDTHILANNIFGVDINRESVELTKLSLWLKTANRNEKLSYLDDNIKTGNSLIDNEDIAGDLAFDWGTAFPAAKPGGKFDVVVGNPPYVDSEAMAKFWFKEREWLTTNFHQTRGNWDLYIAFLELGHNLMAHGGYLSFITPDKWISKDFGIEIRKRTLPGIVSILPLGRGVFKSALIDSIITTISKKPVKTLQIMALDAGEVVSTSEVTKKGVTGQEGFDQFLSSGYSFIKKVETATPRRLGEISEAENACATSDTYVLAEYIKDVGSLHGYDSDRQYKVANTGTLDRYVFRWGNKPMRYLKEDYAFPIVSKKSFEANLGKTYQRRAASPKIIIKGLTLLDGALDLDASFIPGKSTIVICNKSRATLKFLAGIVNSRFASFYVKQKYASASYNGGVNFTPDMINSIPIPGTIDEAEVTRQVDLILQAQGVRFATTSSMHDLIRASGGPAKMRRKLDSWYILDNKEFIAELAKQGLELSVRDRAEWIDILKQHKTKIAQSLIEAEKAQKTIDNLINNGLGLTPAECQQILAEKSSSAE